jgi:hypothetical protein
VSHPNYPVQLIANRTIGIAGAESAIAARMNTVPYAFSTASSGTLITTKSVRTAALLNSAGQYVYPSTATVQAAMMSFDDASNDRLFQGALFGTRRTAARFA